MGVKHGKSTLYHLSKLPKHGVAAILRGLHESRKEGGDLRMSMPTIDGDSNNICYIWAGKSANKSTAVGQFYSNWAKCGLKVTPVVDGDVRPTSKQATNARVAEREKSRMKGHILLKEAQTIKRNISNGVYTTPEQLTEMKDTIKKKEQSGRKKFTQSECKIPMDFADALEDSLVNDFCVRSPDGTGGYVAPVLKAKFQADAAIIGRFINGETLMAITNDSDIPILGGDDFIALKEYSKDGNMTLVSTSKATLAKAMEYLPDELRGIVKLEDAEWP